MFDERWIGNEFKWETDGMLIDAKGFSINILHVLTIKSPKCIINFSFSLSQNHHLFR